MPPPPAPVTESFIRQHMLQLAAVRDEHDEIRRLKREIEKKKLEQELATLSSPTQPTQPTKVQRRSIDFYEQQIVSWFNRLPPEARKAPRSMQEFLNLLQGRTPGLRAHAPEVSRVLLEAGWSRRRNWVSDSGRRLWWPPCGI